MDKIAIIIPTYNESGNIERLIKKILSLNLPCQLFIIDDDSPDGTSEIVGTISKKNKNVSLIQRFNKRGRGSAVIDGFKKALEDKDIRYFFEMDADFSHDPRDITRFLEMIKEADVVIGSRYLPQSKIIEWPVKRLIFSKIANTYARLILKIPISDYTNGYRCYKRKVLEALNFSKINASGYIVLSEMAYQIYRKGFKFADIPIVFVNRRRGLSNLRMKEITDAFTSVIKTRFNK